jgi:hypothetical protein
MNEANSFRNDEPDSTFLQYKSAFRRYLARDKVFVTPPLRKIFVGGMPNIRANSKGDALNPRNVISISITLQWVFF